MRKSLGGSYGGAGGGGNGGEMLRSVGRVVKTRLNNFQESIPSPNSSSTTSSNIKTSSATAAATTTTTKTKNVSSKHALSLSSPTPNNGPPLPVTTAWAPPPTNYFDDEDNVFSEVDNEWECFENYYDPVFGVVPSTNEVQHALLSLQQVFDPHSCSQSITEEIYCDADMDMNMDDQTKSATDTLQRASSKGSDTDWLEPSMLPYNWKLTQSPGWGTVHDAFHLLQTEPSVQRMVVSLSSDKAVWDAVLNNEAVREIRDSYRDAAEYFPLSSENKSGSSKGNVKMLQWIFENMKTRLLEVLKNVSQFVGHVFKPLDHDKEEQSSAFMEKMKSTFLLTVVVLLIVVVARGHTA